MAAKQVYLSDVMRFFRVNGLAIDEHRVRDTLFGRIIGHGRVFDY